MDRGGQSNCADAWAPRARVHHSDDQPAAEHGEMYVFGSLVVVVMSTGTISLFVVADVASIYRKTRTPKRCSSK